MNEYSDQEMVNLALNYLNNLGISVGLMHPIQILELTVRVYNERRERGFEQ